MIRGSGSKRLGITGAFNDDMCLLRFLCLVLVSSSPCDGWFRDKRLQFTGW